MLELFCIHPLSSSKARVALTESMFSWKNSQCHRMLATCAPDPRGKKLMLEKFRANRRQKFRNALHALTKIGCCPSMRNQ